MRPDVTSPVNYVLNIQRDGEVDAGLLEDDGLPGRYTATFFLGIPGLSEARGNVHFDRLVSQSDSLITVDPRASSLTLHVREAQTEFLVELGVNAAHHLSFMRTNVEAQDFDHAHRLTHDLIMPMVSRLSFTHNVGLAVTAVEVAEARTGSRSFHLTIVGQYRPLSDTAGTDVVEHQAMLATFREGANSLSNFYQALSFYKVIEGCYDLRNRRRLSMESTGTPYVAPAERFPEDYSEIMKKGWHEGHRADFKEFLGQKFTWARDEYRKRVRDSIAHLLDEVEPLMLDSWEDTQYIQHVVPVLRYMALILLAEELTMPALMH